MNTQTNKIKESEVKELSKEYQLVLDNYKNFLKTRNLRNKSIVSYIDNTKPFLLFLNDNKIKISNMTKNDVYKYIENLNNYSIITKQNRLYCIKNLINWLFQENIVKFNGYNVLPKIVVHHDSTLVSYYTKEEITTLLNSMNIFNKKENRDYLIICLIVYMGYRTSDIVNLKFSNIDFENNTINIIQHKTNKELSLPLIDEVKFPLLDYIKNYRDKSDSNYIFLSCNPPYNELKGNMLKNDITKYLKRANIDISNRKHGPHALRHSLSNSLLQNNIPLEQISEILGHRNISATEKYISIDIKQLKILSLEVPPIC